MTPRSWQLRPMQPSRTGRMVETGLRVMAVIWTVFGALGLVTLLLILGSLARSAEPGAVIAWAVWSALVSAALVVSGLGVLRRRPWASWLATAAVSAALAEALVLSTSGLPGTPNPVLTMTAAVHVVGLSLLVLGHPRAARPPRGADADHGIDHE